VGCFQDADESACYEFFCKRTSIAVHCCGEQFENDGSPVSTIVEGRQACHGQEYSRELSSKVSIGQCRLIELGFRPWTTALLSHKGRRPRCQRADPSARTLEPEMTNPASSLPVAVALLLAFVELFQASKPWKSRSRQSSS
jgi:hypothetical protein